MKFDYFSERTVGLLRNAHKIAADLNFEDVGTDHLLLAMTDDSIIFEKLGYDNNMIKREISMLLGSSDFHQEPSTYTQRAKKVIENSIAELDFIHHTSVEPEHLLLSLTKENECVAINALLNLDINILEFRNRVADALIS